MKKLIKLLVILLTISLVLGLTESLALATEAKKELTPYEWSRLKWKEKIEAKNIVIRDCLWTKLWMEEKNLPTDVTGVREKIHSGDTSTPVAWYNVALFGTAYPNVYIEARSFPGLYWAPEALPNLVAAMAGGDAPSLYYLVDASRAINLGLGADITDLIKGWDQIPLIEERNPGLFKKKVLIQGRYYGLLSPGTVSRSIVYRTDKFKKAGIFNEKGEPGPPKDWTWTDFRDLCKKLTNAKEKEWGYAHFSTANWADIDLISYITSYGYPITALTANEVWGIPDTSGKFTWKFGYIPQLANGIKFLNDMLYQDKSMFLTDNITSEIRSGRIAMKFSAAAREPFIDGWGKPNAYDPVISTKDLLRVSQTPTSSYGIRVNTVDSNFLMFNPTLSKEQLKAAFEWAKWNLYGKGFELRMNVTIDRFQAGLRPSPWTVYEFETMPYKPPIVEGYEEMKNVMMSTVSEGYESWQRVRKAEAELPSIPSPIEYGLTMAPNAHTFILNAVEGLLSDPNADMETIKIELGKAGERVNPKYFNFKIENDKEKFKAWVTAVDEFYSKYYPKWHESEEYKEQLEEYWKVW